MSDTANPGKRAQILSVLDQYEGPLTRYAARIVGDIDTARDVVQETFLKYVSNGSPEDESKTAQWLYTVCRNQALDVLRKDKRMKPLSMEHAQSQVADGASPTAGLELSETAGQVMGMLAGLSENQQEVIRLRFQDGLSYREIAGVTELSVTNVGYLIHTAIKTIREKLSGGVSGDSSNDSTGKGGES